MSANRTIRRTSFAVTLTGILIVVTPLCGDLFHCGCTWPWSGLTEDCNFFDPGEAHPCPFCLYTAYSIPLLTGIALIALAAAGRMSRRLSLANPVLVDSLYGLVVFILLVAMVAPLFQAAMAIQLSTVPPGQDIQKCRVNRPHGMLPGKLLGITSGGLTAGRKFGQTPDSRSDRLHGSFID